MKNLYFLLLFLGIGPLMGQNTANLILFTENGEPFFAYVNNVKQNQTAAGNVKITDMTAEYVNLKIEFADPSLGSFSRNLSLMFGHEFTAQIRMNNKGKYVIRPFSQPVPIASAPSLHDDVPVIIYHEEPYVDVPHTESVIIHSEKPVPPSTTISYTEKVETTPGNTQVDVIMPGIQMNVNIDENTNHTQITTTTTTTTTTTLPSRPVIYEPLFIEETVVEESLIPGYNGPIGCGGYLMSDQPFKAALQSISSKTFEGDRMTMAKQICRNQCLTTTQVKEIMELFTFETTKLDWAKLAYDHTYDIGNYWMLNDGFTFSSSISELDQFIQSK